jgi:hypothetical protein
MAKPPTKVSIPTIKYNIFGSFTNLSVDRNKRGYFGQSALNIYDPDIVLIYEISDPFIKGYANQIMSAKPLPIDATIAVKKYLEAPIEDGVFQDLFAYLCTTGGETELADDFTDDWEISFNYEYVELNDDQKEKTLCRVYICSPTDEFIPAVLSAMASCRVSKLQNGMVELSLSEEEEA